MAIYGQLLSNDIRYVINEAYVGKTDTLLEIENQINVIRSSIKKFTDINKSKEVQKLNRLFEKQFGMEVFSLNIIQDNTMNAYTIPINTRFDIALKTNISRMVEGSKDTGYRFKEGNGLAIVCYVYWGLIMNPMFTDEEILAVMLHELGHNFADAIYDKIKIANKKMMREYYSFAILKAILTFGLDNELISNTNKKVKKKESKKIKNPLRGILNGFKGIKDNFSSFVSEVIARLGGGLGWKLTKLGVDEEKQKDYIKSKNTGRQNEVIADAFAGVYGYGPAQASALLKMTDYQTKAEKLVEKIPLIGKISNNSFNDATKDLCNFDVHPHVIQRAVLELRLLKEELNKTDLDPKLEKVIKEQIKQLEDMLDEATKIVDDAQKSEVAKKEFNKFILNEDPDAVTKEIEDEIFTALDDALNKN